MRKLLAGLLTALLLLVSPIGVSAISDPGRPEVTRLFASTDEGSNFACTASYIFPYISDYGSWVVSAGHCAEANLVSRNQAVGIRGVVNWRGVLNTHSEYGGTTVDLALGTVPDVRDGEHKRLWLADAAPTGTARVYIHGFPEGVETVTSGVLVPVGAEERISLLVLSMQEGYPNIIRKKITELFPGTRVMLVKHDRVMGGSSGSPVLNDQDRLIGILWGGFQYSDALEIQGVPSQFAGWDLVFMTPVERVHELFKSLGVNG